MESLCNDIIFHAWNFLDKDEILTAFARTVWRRLGKSRRVISGADSKKFLEELRTSENRRRSLIESVLQQTKQDQAGQEVSRLSFSLSALCVASDFAWLLERARDNSTDQKTKETLIELIARMFRADSVDHFEIISTACNEDTAFGKRFDWLFEVVELNSARAKQLQQEYRNFTLVDEGSRPLDPPRAERIHVRLTQSEQNNPESWFDLTRQLTLDEDSDNESLYGDDLDTSIHEYPGWKLADELTRQRILDAAFRFVTDPRCDPKTDQWLGTTSLDLTAVAGYKALALLKRERSALLDRLDQDCWKRWVGIVLTCPNQNNVEEFDMHKCLVGHAYQTAPGELLSALRTQMRFENEEYGRLSVLTVLEDCVDQDMTDFVMAEFRSHKWQLESCKTIIEFLLRGKSDAAKVWAMQQVEQSSAHRESDQILVAAAGGLLKFWTQESFPTLFDIFKSDRSFAEIVLKNLARWWEDSNVLNHFTEEQLGDLFILLNENVQGDGAPEGGKDMVRLMSLDDMFSDFKSSIPDHISRRGTAAAALALEHILDRFPDLLGVRSMLDGLRQNLEVTSWNPYQPKDILQIANNRHARLVSSETELMDVLIEALADLQIEILGHQPVNQRLWNETSLSFVKSKLGQSTASHERHKKLYTPKDEAAFCNLVVTYLNEHLISRGVVANREVVIRANPGGKGERTDIHVDAISLQNSQFQRLTAVIEAKGNWNQELFTAMESQLCGQYLHESKSRSGIYLTGFFTCTQWDESDSRKTRCKNQRLPELQHELQQQAVDLSRRLNVDVRSVVLDVSLRQQND